MIQHEHNWTLQIYKNKDNIKHIATCECGMLLMYLLYPGKWTNITGCREIAIGGYKLIKEVKS